MGSTADLSSARDPAFHRFAVGTHMERYYAALKGADETAPIPDLARLAIVDALSWAERLYNEVHGYKMTKSARTKARVQMSDDERDFDDFVQGCEWARHRIIHGDVHVIRFETVRPERVKTNAQIPFNAFIPFSGLPPHGFKVRFAAVRDAIAGDQWPEKREMYNRTVAGDWAPIVVSKLAWGDRAKSATS